ncbi:uncharacterized protein LOC111392238 [Olea europaea var. sylvestris]|uniref:uncharacterized protein LOC111392238 n=1 Tax=Olea europaea var. sylvestris TaxID=158386 RepID=UPI000C1CDA00|nr:uncharacterized protein LOC111392238 [Olea europaea var. sylvestris]
MVRKLSYFPGFQVKQTNDGLFICQSNCVKDIVKRFGLDSKKHTRTPMSTSVKLSHDLTGKSVDQTLYESMIGNLLYLSACRSGIAFSVGLCLRFQADPKKSHLYHKLLYSRDSNLDLAYYSDANWARNVDNRKSTSGGYFYVDSNLVVWMSKKTKL